MRGDGCMECCWSQIAHCSCYSQLPSDTQLHVIVFYCYCLSLTPPSSRYTYFLFVWMISILRRGRGEGVMQIIMKPKKSKWLLRHQGQSQYKDHLRWSRDRIIFIMGIPILLRWHLCMEAAARMGTLASHSFSWRQCVSVQLFENNGKRLLLEHILMYLAHIDTIYTLDCISTDLQFLINSW